MSTMYPPVVSPLNNQKNARTNLNPEAIQKLLEENSQLIAVITDYQSKGRTMECIDHQRILHRNLTYLTQFAPANEQIHPSSLPPPETFMATPSTNGPMSMQGAPSVMMHPNQQQPSQTAIPVSTNSDQMYRTATNSPGSNNLITNSKSPLPLPPNLSQSQNSSPSQQQQPTPYPQSINTVQQSPAQNGPSSSPIAPNQPPIPASHHLSAMPQQQQQQQQQQANVAYPMRQQYPTPQQPTVNTTPPTSQQQIQPPRQNSMINGNDHHNLIQHQSMSPAVQQFIPPNSPYVAQQTPQQHYAGGNQQTNMMNGMNYGLPQNGIQMPQQQNYPNQGLYQNSSINNLTKPNSPLNTQNQMLQQQPQQVSGSQPASQSPSPKINNQMTNSSSLNQNQPLSNTTTQNIVGNPIPPASHQMQQQQQQQQQQHLSQMAQMNSMYGAVGHNPYSQQHPQMQGSGQYMNPSYHPYAQAQMNQMSGGNRMMMHAPTGYGYSMAQQSQQPPPQGMMGGHGMNHYGSYGQ